MADPTLRWQGLIRAESFPPIPDKLLLNEMERHRLVYQAIIDAAVKARETGQEQLAGFDCMGCAVVVRPPA